MAAAFLVFLLTAVITDYRPADREVLQDRSVISTANPPAASHDRQASEGSPDALPDSVTILCWNIGYGGLGDDMDFFYDGGTQVRTSRERTLANIEGIISEIRRHDADIILLQEVDECSRRTYRINEVEMLRKAFPDYHIYLAYNYKSFFNRQRCGADEPYSTEGSHKMAVPIAFHLAGQHVQPQTLPPHSHIPSR